mgnify:FL=1|tara:strand:- start:22 stop:432 length:411 start_codon:yes stop_codon:yes gene_type:complete
MGTVTEGQKFMGLASTMDTTEKKSVALNANTAFFTIEDIQMYANEDLAASGAASLTKPISYFTTAAAETATLAAGTDGQIKIFHMVGDGGDMVITVTNPGWGGSGTMTFADAQDSVILVYVASKWRVITNIGVALA